MMPVRAMALVVVGLAPPDVCGAQNLPEVTASGGEYVLSVPYLDYGSGVARQAYAAILRSRDLSTFVLDAATVSPLTPLALPVDAPRLTALNAAYRLDVPRVAYRASSTLYYAAALTSADLIRFVVDPSSVREVGPPGSLPAPTGVTVSNAETRTVGSLRIS